MLLSLVLSYCLYRHLCLALSFQCLPAKSRMLFRLCLYSVVLDCLPIAVCPFQLQMAAPGCPWLPLQVSVCSCLVLTVYLFLSASAIFYMSLSVLANLYHSLPIFANPYLSISFCMFLSPSVPANHFLFLSVCAITYLYLSVHTNPCQSMPFPRDRCSSLSRLL